MTKRPGDEPYRPGTLSRALVSLLRLCPARGRDSESVTAARDVNADLLNHLSPEGRHVLDVARIEARNLGHGRVSTEHLLLALTRDPNSGACRVLEQLGTTPARVRMSVLDSLLSGADPDPGALGLTPRARLAVELGHRASARIGVPLTAPEHLLIGLATEREGIAAKTLRKCGITARAAESRVASDLDGRTAAPRGKGAVPREAAG